MTQDGSAEVARRVLAVTMGDPAGIGLDITLAAWRDREALKLPPFILYGCPSSLAERAAALGLACPLQVLEGMVSANRLKGDSLPVVPIAVSRSVHAGTPDVENGAAVIASIERAVADTIAGRTAAVVTNPIAKATLYAGGFRHPGHTEFLAELASRHVPGRTWVPVMMLASEALKVVPLTIHIPVADVPGALTGPLIEQTIAIVHADMMRYFAIPKPRIVVAGLNPHAGESGTIGREDVDIIAPAVARLVARGLDVRGPLSADTLFHAAARRTYDVAVCMYHDQALIPIKTLAFDEGVNVTLGLPFVRTSPDHGTAFDIAGQGRASPTSLIEAMRLAQRMATAAEANR